MSRLLVCSLGWSIHGRVTRIDSELTPAAVNPAGLSSSIPATSGFGVEDSAIAAPREWPRTMTGSSVIRGSSSSSHSP